MNKPKILIPIHPQWCEKIFNGEKTIEVRKTAPKIDTPFEALVYCTKAKNIRAYGLYLLPNDRRLHLGCEEKDLEFVCREGDFRNGKVIGSFICDGIDHIHTLSFDDKLRKQTCLPFEALVWYLGELDGMFYGWHITEPKLFDRPKDLSEFGTICKKDGNDECGDCPYLQVHVNSYPCDDCVDTWCGVGNIKPLTRAPQSWIYVETV